MCLESQGHGLTVELTVDGDFEERFLLERLRVGEQMRNAHRNEERTTENGAYGVAVLAACCLTACTVLEQSRKWTGFDYWLGSKDELHVQRAVCLEVSGIRRGTEKMVRSRLREKISQMQAPTLGGIERPLIAIVDFGRPNVRIVEL